MYFQNHIWSSNETNIQANQHFRAKILAQKGSHQVYSNISKSLDWFTINYVMDAINRFEHAFYIFQSEWKIMVTLVCVGQKLAWQCKNKAWMTYFTYARSFFPFSKSQS
jgi:hypothetical protein